VIGLGQGFACLNINVGMLLQVFIFYRSIFRKKYKNDKNIGVASVALTNIAGT